MEISRKDRILKWLCKKARVESVFFDSSFNDSVLKFSFMVKDAVGKMDHLIVNYAIIEETRKAIAKEWWMEGMHMLDILLDVSRKGFTISNGVNIDGYYVVLMPPFMSLEQILIEMDLNEQGNA